MPSRARPTAIGYRKHVATGAAKLILSTRNGVVCVTAEGAYMTPGYRYAIGKHSIGTMNSRRTEIRASVVADGENDMKRLIAVVSFALLSACGTAKYEVNPDGSTPILYSATDVM